MIPVIPSNSTTTTDNSSPDTSQPSPSVTAAPADTSEPDSEDPALLPIIEHNYPGPGEALPPSEATLDRILEIAATDSNTMREQAQMVASNDASRYRSWVKYLPAVDARYNVGFFDLIRGDIQGGSETAFGGAYTVEASRPLYYWGAIDATEKLALLKEKIAQTQAIITYAKLCVSLRSQYYQLIADKAGVTLLTRETESAARRLEKERQLFAAGKILPIRVDRANISYENLQIQEATAENTFQATVGDFRNLSGAYDFDEKDVPDYVVIPRIDFAKLHQQFDGFRKSGFVDSVVAKSADLQQDAIDNVRIINRANQKPTFNIGVGVTQGPYEDTSSKTGGIYFQTIVFGGITGTWHLFDNDQTSDNDRDLLAQRRLVDADLDASRDQLFSQAANLLDKMEIAQRGISMLKDQLVSLQANYRLEKQSLALGQTDQTEVDEVRDGILQLKFHLLQYQTNLVAGYYGFLTSIFLDPALSNVDSYNHTPSP
jgi:outer membrane protein TolC